jgi:hypothetical protein
MRYLLHNSIHTFFLVYTSRDGNQAPLILGRFLMGQNTNLALNNYKNLRILPRRWEQLGFETETDTLKID